MPIKAGNNFDFNKVRELRINMLNTLVTLIISTLKQQNNLDQYVVYLNDLARKATDNDQLFKTISNHTK